MKNNDKKIKELEKLYEDYVKSCSSLLKVQQDHQTLRDRIKLLGGVIYD